MLMKLRKMMALTLAFMTVLSPSFGFAVVPPYSESEETVLKSKESYTSVVEINGRDLIYFAQNSPEWDAMRIDSSRKSFGNNYCSILALAVTLANCVPYEELPDIDSLARLPFRVDSTHADYEGGYEKSHKFIIQRECDILRFLPLVIANIVTGNNKTRYKETMIVSRYVSFFDALGLEYGKTSDLDACYEALRNGAFVITCTGGANSPIAPKYGHYFVLAGIDNQYVYCIDSIYRDSYPDDRHHVIQMIQPGVFKYAIEDTKFMSLHGTKCIAFPKDGCPCYTPVMFEHLISASNNY